MSSIEDEDISRDWRDLLKRYMLNVLAIEGNHCIPREPDKNFTAEECAALRKILEEIEAD